MRPYVEFDTECAVNYWLLKFYFPMGHMRSFELRPGKPQFTAQERVELARIFGQFTLVGFNSLSYDLPMVKYAMSCATTEQLKQLNDHIIVGGLKHWHVRQHYPQADIADLDHIDIMEVAPGVRIGLKTYMARMHSKTIQDLPFDPAAVLDEPTIAITEKYCGNDLIGTRELRETIASRLKLRERLSGVYGVDLRSKSDAQMSEAIIAAQLGYRPDVPYIPSGHTFKFRPAPWLQFATKQLQDVFETCRNVDFLWSNNEDGDEIEAADGSKIKTGVNMPADLKKIRVKIGSSVYKFGIGGLHSQESGLTLYSSPGATLKDRDVGSFYPSLAILLQLFNAQVMAIYANIYLQRMDAKPKLKTLQGAALDELETLVNGFKIVMNGWYGKLWSRYSFALDPAAGIAITLNGQLSLLMLIERLELGGVSVVSANTDGIICHVPAHLHWYYEQTFAWWESATGLTTDETPYRSIHMRDVNNYVAIKPDGSVKRKGVFSESGVLASMQGVHPDRDIAKDAVVKYLQDGTPLEQTVRACHDIRKFVLSRKVKGSGKWREGYLGGSVRWYYSTSGEPIRYVSNNNKVAGSDGAMPIQVLPDAMPADVDYAQYVAYAEKLLALTCATNT